MNLRKLIVAALILCMFQTFGQGASQKGYYIDNLDNRIEVFFKYIDVETYEFIEVKKQETDEFSKVPVSQIKEYGVGSDFKFVRTTVKLDVSAGIVSMNKEPKLESTTIFLNTILEGKASLYSYNDGAITRYFFITDKQPLKQLIYKKYQPSSVATIIENTSFRNQIFENLFCSSIDVASLTNLKYNRLDLVNIFTKYNKCSDAENIIYENKAGRKPTFILTTYLGIFNSFASFHYLGNKSETTNSITPVLGIEFATRFPSQKLEFLARFEYEKLKSSPELILTQGVLTTSDFLIYDSGILNFSLGARHNFLFKENSNFFADFNVNLGVPLDDFQDKYEVLNLQQYIGIKRPVTARGVGFSLNFGVGYKINKKIGLDLRYHPSINYVSDRDPSFEAHNSRLGFTFRYAIL